MKCTSPAMSLSTCSSGTLFPKDKNAHKDVKGPENIGFKCDDVRGDVLRPSHGTTPASEDK